MGAQPGDGGDAARAAPRLTRAYGISELRVSASTGYSGRVHTEQGANPERDADRDGGGTKLAQHGALVGIGREMATRGSLDRESWSQAWGSRIASRPVSAPAAGEHPGPGPSGHPVV